jgi:hypothetical protein
VDNLRRGGESQRSKVKSQKSKAKKEKKQRKGELWKIGRSLPPRKSELYSPVTTAFDF